MKTLLILLMVFGSVFYAEAYAQATPVKNSRVIELEDKLEEDAYHFLGKRFPGLPFTIRIDITPLRRRASDYKEGENLPYYELESEEVQDEWDNPYLSVYQLLPRINKARVDLTVPNTIATEEVEELKNDLLNYLNLIPGRDELNIAKRNWRDVEKKDYTTEIIILASTLVFLVGFFFILRSTGKTLGKSMNSASAKPASSGASAGGVPSSSLSSSSKKSGDSGQDFSGDLQLRDPIKLKEVVKHKITELERDENFPLLSDMIAIDRLAQKYPQALGALIYEFSINIQRKLFTLGRSTLWYEIFSEPGSLDDHGINLVDRMLRLREASGSKMWNHLLIQIWRLGEEADKFLLQLNQNEVFLILKDMPKSFSIPLARKIYPGSWGLLLNNQRDNEPVSEERIKELFKMSVRLKPRFDIQTLNEYNKDKDLIEYVKFTDVQEERDIYMTLSANSLLTQIRPPFYKIFEAPEDVLKGLINIYSLEDWAKALFNSPWEFRNMITKLLNQKMQYLLGHHFKIIDKSSLNLEEQAKLKEDMAFKFTDLMAKYTLAKEQEASQKTQEQPAEKKEETTEETPNDDQGEKAA